MRGGKDSNQARGYLGNYIINSDLVNEACNSLIPGSGLRRTHPAQKANHILDSPLPLDRNPLSTLL
uniref:Uncharacterized protein n=1 Tax=Picea glauca TaxID=3330 RepID=A0A117NG67_PICGL|nr:hypothetical protein ABT39_MTgene1834 [Picea glauca]